LRVVARQVSKGESSLAAAVSGRVHRLVQLLDRVAGELVADGERGECEEVEHEVLLLSTISRTKYHTAACQL
jgi:hypothetical protein